MSTSSGRGVEDVGMRRINKMCHPCVTIGIFHKSLRHILAAASKFSPKPGGGSAGYTLVSRAHAVISPGFPPGMRAPERVCIFVS